MCAAHRSLTVLTHTMFTIARMVYIMGYFIRVDKDDGNGDDDDDDDIRQHRLHRAFRLPVVSITEHACEKISAHFTPTPRPNSIKSFRVGYTRTAHLLCEGCKFRDQTSKYLSLIRKYAHTHTHASRAHRAQPTLRLHARMWVQNTAIC